MPDDESALIRRIAAKDKKAFEALYQLYYRRLFGYLVKLTRRLELVEEVLDDVMLAIWSGAQRFDGRSRPSTWIFGIAYHKAIKALSRRRPEEAGGEKEDETARIDHEEPESLMVRRELSGVVGRALAALPAEQRAVVELTYFYGRSYNEIAAIVGCPVNTVKTRMFHARRKLRQLLPQLGVSSHAG
jgi:RNA polymerase sigma-70 factor (ECF subfamily)